MIGRRSLLGFGLAALTLPGCVTTQPTTPGAVLLMHGKQGMPQFSGLQRVRAEIQGQGLRCEANEMPWSRMRYLDGSLDGAFDEIEAALAAFRRAGATRMFLAGHSIGAATAVAYAVHRGGIDGISMIAPGHLPKVYYETTSIPLNARVRAAIDKARAMRAAGDGASAAEFADNNQMTVLSPRMRADDYLSWFDPDGKLEVEANMSRVSCPVQWVIGTRDNLFASSKPRYFDRLPPNPQHEFVQVEADHVETLAAAATQIGTFFKRIV
ncbi:alpha/beta fold hydrolase [Arenibaculum pallidiluteum]|uniref:alpha/beta hydrolase n=1 Tax=Arenibaculum pallidiluteum TaxID=2812559 RepID=UPI001A95AF9E|nr:alpha/beta hydrolase [Arenibaculum pallidiluteum]